MSKVFRASTAAGLVTLLCLSACDVAQTPQEPPADAALRKAIGELYLRSGFANDVSSTSILGKHYRLAHDSWKVVACVEFVMGASDSGRDCNDSFELYRLDSGSWMVNGTLNGAYRWVELPESELVSAANPDS